VKSNPDPGRLSPVPETEKISGIKYNSLTTKPITNINAEVVPTPPGSLNTESLKMPTNGPFPISFFSHDEAPMDKKLISFLKNNNN
jgi:hypothetical protein